MQTTLQKRSIPLYILLCFFTFGIFGLLWFYFIAEDLCGEDTPSRLKSTPGMALLFSLLTCGIYGLYAYYQWGRQLPEVYAKYGLYTEDRGILYLVLGLLRFGLVCIALIQNDLNHLAGHTTPSPALYPPGETRACTGGPKGAPPPQRYDPCAAPIPTACVDTTLPPYPPHTGGTH